MKALVLTNMYPYKEEPWYGSFVKEQIDALRLLGMEIDVLSFDGRHRKANYLRAARGLRRLIETARFDLIHAHYGLCGAIALCQRKLPVVTTFWGSDTGYVRWQGYVSWAVARLTTPIFVARSNARRLGCNDATIIPSAVDLGLFKPMERAVARSGLGWQEDGRYVLFPGARQNRRKRSDLFDAVLREVKRHTPGTRGISLEGFTRAQVPLVMNASDVVLMTSDFEGSPLAIKEALACGTPVVSVPVGDVPESVADVEGCVIAPREPAALARGVLHAFDAGRPAALRRRAEDFSSERVAARVVRVYEQAVSRH
jgi:glycosyltransferase involved in cell wall biosynthesis